MLEHGVDDRQKLAHARHKRHLLGLPSPTQAVIEGTNDRIERVATIAAM